MAYYYCKACNQVLERDSDERQIKSMCDKSGKDVILTRVDIKLSVPLHRSIQLKSVRRKLSTELRLINNMSGVPMKFEGWTFIFRKQQLIDNIRMIDYILTGSRKDMDSIFDNKPYIEQARSLNKKYAKEILKHKKEVEKLKTKKQK